MEHLLNGTLLLSSTTCFALHF